MDCQIKRLDNGRRAPTRWLAAGGLLAIVIGPLPAAAAEVPPSELARTAERIDRLQRPLSQSESIFPTSTSLSDVSPSTTIGDLVTTPLRPADRSETLLASEPAHWISNEDQMTMLPDRDTVGRQHRPLYFEEPRLERQGDNWGYLQNAVSASCFLGRTLTLPVRILANRVRQ